MVHNSAYLCLCSISHPGNSACSCTWASLHCCQNITFSTPLFFTLHIHLWEGISLPQNSVYGFKCFTMWNSAMLVVLPVFHNNRSTISTAKPYTKCLSA